MMRKLWFAAILAILAILFSSADAKSGPLDLDPAIKQTAQEINDALPAGSKVALLNFTSESDAFSEYVLEEMSIELVKARKLVVVDRKELDLIRTEKDFQWSGEVSDESAQEIGKLLGAQTIVSGSLVSIGKDYRFRTKAINVESAAIETSSSLNIKTGKLMKNLLSQGKKTPAPKAAAAQSGKSSTPQMATAKGGAQLKNIDIIIVNNTGDTITGLGFFPSGSTDTSESKEYTFRENLGNRGTGKYTIPTVDTTKKYTLMLSDANEGVFVKYNVSFTQNMTITFVASDRYESSGSSTTAQAQPATPASPAIRYKVGDIGPGGGYIFYDKGNNSGGWRYLEAAPVEAEFQAVWTVRGTSVESTQATMGSGRRNTQLIVEKFKNTSGEWDTAAQKSDDLVFNGFNDWFLPSKSELDQMYGNLKRRNLGDFKDGWYWSSSQTGSSSNGICGQNFSNGNMDEYGYRYSKYYVRPIRLVAGQ